MIGCFHYSDCKYFCDVVCTNHDKVDLSTVCHLSFIACVSFGTYVIYLLWRYRQVETEHTPDTSGIRFLRTQAGFIYAQLLVSDLIQAIGFGLTWNWFGRNGILGNSKTCSFQGVSIQAGDLGTTFFSLLIAFHTLIILVWRRRPTKIVMLGICALAWIAVIVLTAIGPAAIQTPERGRFYGPVGGSPIQNLSPSHS